MNWTWNRNCKKGGQEMSSKDWAVLGGICTIVGAATAASQKRRWEDAHKAAAIVGGIVAIAGALR
jgi:hypothetical protein